MNSKQISFTSIWNKYLPAIRILLKKAGADGQSLGMNRTDFERAAGIRKSGYRFSVTLINGRPDTLYSGNDLVQSFISILMNDGVIHDYLLQNNYTFTFTSKYQLQIKNISASKKEVAAEELMEN